jgi:hypothetical protein
LLIPEKQISVFAQLKEHVTFDNEDICVSHSGSVQGKYFLVSLNPAKTQELDLIHTECMNKPACFHNIQITGLKYMLS